MQKRAVTVWLMGMAFLGWSVLAGPQSVAAATKGRPDVAPVPNVYGGGILWAFSGLDGMTSSAEPCVASTLPEGLGLAFHVFRDPVLKVYLPEGQHPEWQMVSNDLMTAHVPGDTWPLVIGFASANVVVGRLPPGARVALEGGGLNAVLLRNAVGDRTVFAFAYDARGAKAAADAAAAGLRVSIDTLVEGRADFFTRVPRAPDGTRRAQAVALAKAFSVMKVNVYAPESPIAVRWTTSSRWPHQFMGLWDSAFNSLGLMHLDRALAKETLDAVYGCQGDDGMIGQRLGPGQTPEVSQPPVLGWATWRIYTQDKMQDRAMLERAFDVVQKHAVWFMKTHRLDGEPPPEKALEHGTPLYAWKSPEESGADNSPRFDTGAGFAAVDLSCYLADECWMLQQMAQRLGYRELAKTWGQRGDAIADAARKHLWDGERGFFLDRQGPAGEWVGARTFAGFLPLWAGIATPGQAARLREHLVSEKFMGPAGVRTVARDDPNYKKDMWRGPTWVTVNYLLIQGLRRYGFEPEAEDLRRRTLETVAKWYAKTGCLWEFYDSDDQTPPADLDRKGRLASGAGQPVAADYLPTAALYADLLLRPKS